jgi:hypothetical protein
MRVLRRATIAFVVIYLGLAAWGTVRRLFQVLRLDLSVSSIDLRPGSTVSIDVVTSGEVHNRVLLELVQGERSETLIDFKSRLSAVNTLDPRLFRYTPTVTVPPGLLSRFDAGSATLRLTGFGGPKLLRIPSPRIRTLEVRITPR